MPSLYLHISIEKIFIIMSYKELCISSLHLLGHIGNMLFKDILQDTQFIWSQKRNIVKNSLNDVLQFYNVKCSSESKDSFFEKFYSKICKSEK